MSQVSPFQLQQPRFGAQAQKARGVQPNQQPQPTVMTQQVQAPQLGRDVVPAKKAQPSETSAFRSGGSSPQFGMQTLSASGGDQLSEFRNQMQTKRINPNLNAPAIPYTATRSWSA